MCRSCLGCIVHCSSQQCEVQATAHRKLKLEFKGNATLPGSIQITPTIPPASRKLINTSGLILSAFGSHYRSWKVLVHWVILAVLCIMIIFVANEAMLGLGIAISICRLKTRLRG